MKKTNLYILLTVLISAVLNLGTSHASQTFPLLNEDDAPKSAGVYASPVIEEENKDFINMLATEAEYLIQSDIMKTHARASLIEVEQQYKKRRQVTPNDINLWCGTVTNVDESQEKLVSGLDKLWIKEIIPKAGPKMLCINKAFYTVYTGYPFYVSDKDGKQILSLDLKGVRYPPVYFSHNSDEMNRKHFMIYSFSTISIPSVRFYSLTSTMVDEGYGNRLLDYIKFTKITNCPEDQISSYLGSNFYPYVSHGLMVNIAQGKALMCNHPLVKLQQQS